MEVAWQLASHTMKGFEDFAVATRVSELVLFVTLALFALTYLCVFCFLQRREHHVRTGSLKEKSNQSFTSPHPGRKV